MERERESRCRRPHEFRKKVLGEKHLDTIQSMADLAVTYHAQGRYEEAEKIVVEVLGLRRDVLGEQHPDPLQAMHDLAICLSSRQRYSEAGGMSPVAV